MSYNLMNIFILIVVIVLCITLMSTIVYYNNRTYSKKYKEVIVLLLILACLYLLIGLFQETTTIIKTDILDVIENTEKYNGFYDSRSVLIVTVFGGLIGLTLAKINSIVNKRNYKKL